MGFSDDSAVMPSPTVEMPTAYDPTKGPDEFAERLGRSVAHIPTVREEEEAVSAAAISDNDAFLLGVIVGRMGWNRCSQIINAARTFGAPGEEQ